MLITVFVSIAATLLALAGLAGAWLLISRALSEGRTAPVLATPAPETHSNFIIELAAEVAALKLAVAGLPSLWQEERERAVQHANRARAAENRTQKLLVASDEDGDEYDEEEAIEALRELNALRGQEGGVLPLHEGMGIPVDADIQERANAAIARGF